MYSDYSWYVTQRKKLNLGHVPLILGKKDGYYNRKNSKKLGDNVILLKECESKKKLIWGQKKEGVHPHYWGKEAWNRGFFSSQLIGLKALNLTIACGCNEIYLLGFDACEINGHTHFYDDTDIGSYVWSGQKHSGVGRKHNGMYNTGNYNKIDELNNYWFKPFEQELQNRIKIYNVSLNSKIDNFPKISYEQFYNQLLTNKQMVNHDEIREEIKEKLAEK